MRPADHPTHVSKHSKTDASTQASPSWPLTRRLALSGGFSLVLCLLLAFCMAPTNTMDDWGISYYLSGRCQGMDICLFINAALCKLTKALNLALPQANWFFVLEHLSSFAAFWALCFAALSYVPLGAGLAVVGFYAAFVLPLCIASSNFTVVSGLCASVGLLYLAVRVYSTRTSWPTAVVGFVLLVLGLLFREQMFVVCLPFMAVIGGWWLIKELRKDKSGRRLVSGLVPVLFALAACVALAGYDRMVWKQDGWRQWREYNDIRAEIVDHLDLMPTYEEASEQLKALGLSKNDYPYIITTMNADLDAIPPSTHRQLLDLQKPLATGPADFVAAMRTYGGILAGRWKYAGAILLVILLAAPFGLRDCLPGIAATAISWSINSYFVLWARLIERVETPVWCFCLVCWLALSGLRDTDADSEKNLTSLRRVGLATSIVLGMACCLGGTFVCLRTHLAHFDAQSVVQLFRQDEFVPTGSISSYLRDYPDTYYLMDGEQYYALEMEYELRYLPNANIMEHIMCTKGWGTGSPYRAHQAAVFGQTNIVATLLVEDNPSLFMASSSTAKKLLTFLREHYDSETTMELVDTIGADGYVCVYRFHGTIPEEGPH